MINLTNTRKSQLQTIDNGRVDFRVFETSGDASGANFLVYANPNADQKTAKIGGENANSGSGIYGNAYADRIVIKDNASRDDNKSISVGRCCLTQVQILKASLFRRRNCKRGQYRRCNSCKWMHCPSFRYVRWI